MSYAAHVKMLRESNDGFVLMYIYCFVDMLIWCVWCFWFLLDVFDVFFSMFMNVSWCCFFFVICWRNCQLDAIDEFLAHVSEKMRDSGCMWSCAAIAMEWVLLRRTWRQHVLSPTLEQKQLGVRIANERALEIIHPSRSFRNSKNHFPHLWPKRCSVKQLWPLWGGWPEPMTTRRSKRSGSRWALSAIRVIQQPWVEAKIKTAPEIPNVFRQYSVRIYEAIQCPSCWTLWLRTPGKSEDDGRTCGSGSLTLAHTNKGVAHICSHLLCFAANYPSCVGHQLSGSQIVLRSTTVA